MRIIDLCFFFKHKTAYELRISDGSSDVCSSDLLTIINLDPLGHQGAVAKNQVSTVVDKGAGGVPLIIANRGAVLQQAPMHAQHDDIGVFLCNADAGAHRSQIVAVHQRADLWSRSEEHTSVLQSLMRISYAVFCLKKKTIKSHQ